jgi:hypothetical protein
VNNLVLSLGVKINDAQFELFSNAHPKVNRVISEEEFLDYFSQDSSMINYDYKHVQVVEMYSFSDKTWEITLPMYLTLTNQLYKALSDDSIKTKLYYSFEVEQISGIKNFSKEVEISVQDILILHELLTKCGTSKLNIPDFYFMLSKMNYQTGPKDYEEASSKFRQTMILSADCKTVTTKEGQEVQAVNYWKVSTG